MGNPLGQLLSPCSWLRYDCCIHPLLWVGGRVVSSQLKTWPSLSCGMPFTALHPQHVTLNTSLSICHSQHVTFNMSLSACHSQHSTPNTVPSARHPQHVTLSTSLKVPNHEDPQRADHTQLSCPTITDAKSIWLNKIEFSFLFVGKWMDRPTICPVPVKTLAFLYFTELHQVHTTEVKLVHIDILSFSCVPVGATDALSWLSMMGKIGSAWELMQMFKTENEKKHGHCAVYWLCLCW